MKRVFIGVGHGGTDPGAVSGALQEKQINLVMALELKRVLLLHGVVAEVSREADRADPLSEKIKRCNAFQPDLAVELHNNAGGGKGFEVYHQTNAHQAESLRLAMDLERYVLELGQNSRGCKTNLNKEGKDTFGWLRNVACPTVLCEGAFLDNERDAKLIDTEEKQRAFGLAYARGVLDYLGIPYSPEGAPAPAPQPVEPNPPAPIKPEPAPVPAPVAPKPEPIPAPAENPASGLTLISGKARCTLAQMSAYLGKQNPDVPDYSRLFLEEGAAEGIRGDIAFAQACLETGHFRFGGDVQPDQNNYCGLGATGNGEPGNRFASPREGVRAQIQHLKAYANGEELTQECVDPRFRYVARGCAPYVEWLGIQENPERRGWAGSAGYGAKVLAILERIAAIPVDSYKSR